MNDVAVLFRMYGDASKGGLVGRQGLQAFMLDMIAASPPASAPPDYRDLPHGSVAEGTTTLPHPLSPKIEQRLSGGEGDERIGNAAVETDFEVSLAEILEKMAAVVLTQVSDRGGNRVRTSLLNEDTKSVVEYSFISP